MMSSNEKVKFRSIPTQENDRPLSTYDNLNNGETKTNGSTTTTPTTATSENECNERCENANEFPFTGISFRFDELKQLQQQQQQQPNTAPIVHTSNGYDNVTNNNYKLHRSSNGNANNTNTNNNHNNNNHHNHNNHHQVTHNDSAHFNGNGVNQRRNSQGHHNDSINVVTTIAQNHSSSAPLSPSPTSSASSSSSSSSAASSSSSSSSENNYKQSSLQYSNLPGNSIANRSSFSKPVHSPAKSQFLGLHKPSNGNESHTESDGKVLNGGGAIRKQSSEKNSLDEVSTVSDEEPLLSNYGNNRIRVTANGGPTSTTTSQYQNVPSNSSCYGQNQIDNANECTCTCKSSDSTNEIQQYESDQYKCNGCLQRNSANASIGVIPISTMNVPSCSKTVDLSSCSTSMKPAKSTPLDTSPSFRMNQSSLSQAVYMSTTVPQNIKGSNIMGSHLPTRNSLRHSRMLVGKKSYQVVRRRNPLSIRHPNTVKYLFHFHVLVGLAVSCLGLWLCWWAPSTSARDNPYWSGIVLMLSGILGVIVLAFKPRPRQKLRQHFITFLRINSVLATFIAAVCTFVASSFAVYHLSNIMSPVADCRPVNIMIDASACTCRFDGLPRNDTMNHHDEIRHGGQYYRDVSCNEVMGFFKYILIASAILNFIGFLLCFALLIMLCMRQKQVKRVPYSSANSRHRL